MSLVCWIDLVRAPVVQRRSLCCIAAALLFAALPARATVIGFVEHEGQRNDNLASGYYTFQVVESPDGRFIYSTAYGSDARVTSVINVFLRDTESGALTAIQTVSEPNNQDYGLRHAKGIAMSPDGTHLYVSGSLNDASDHTLTWFERDTDSGTLRYVDRFRASNLPVDGVTFGDELRFDTEGRNLYVASNLGGGSIVVFERAASGALSYLEAVSHGADLDQVTKFALSSDERSIYALSRSAQALVVLARDDNTGRLNHVQTIDTVSTDSGDEPLANPGDVIDTADRQFVYVTAKRENSAGSSNDDQYAVLTFARLPNSRRLEYRDLVTKTLAFNEVAQWDTLMGANSLALSGDDEQRYVFVGTQDADSINMFERDEAGELRWMGWVTEGENGVTALDGVQDLIVSRDGRHIYAALDLGDGISTFDTRTDLAVVLQADTDPVTAGETLEYELIVTNNGPSDAHSVVATIQLAEGAVFEDEQDQGQPICTAVARIVTCDLGTLRLGAKPTHSITVTAPRSPGNAVSTVSVTTDQIDTNPENDSNEETICVNETDSARCVSGENGGNPVAGGSGSGGDSGAGSVSDWLVLLAVAALGWRRENLV